ncbi:MAG: purine-binding chemotaxis protein CheW [Tissierellia bacterium]|nr:purine-binding chemotaxis protein CheW [Tissierellia bacterium]
MEMDKMQIIIFKLLDKYYALRTDSVEEITKYTDYTRVPNAPDWVTGLINLRGYVVTLLDLASLLKVDAPLEYNNIIICNHQEEKIGLLVEEIIGVREIEENMVRRFKKDMKAELLGIVQMKDYIVNVIDLEKLLTENEG